MRVSVGIVVLISFLHAVNVPPVSSQSTAAETSDKLVHKVIKGEGWRLPKFLSRPVEGKDIIVVNETQIVQQSYGIRSNNETVLETYHLSADGVVIVNVHNVQAERVISYSTNEGRLLGIKVRFHPISKSSHGIMHVAGATIERYFIDKDNNGLFEVMFQTKELPKEMLRPD